MNILVLIAWSVQRTHHCSPNHTFSPWFSESNNNSYYNIKSSCQKENICTDKQLYSSFHSCGTAHFDGILFISKLSSAIYFHVFLLHFQWAHPIFLPQCRSCMWTIMRKKCKVFVVCFLSSIDCHAFSTGYTVSVIYFQVLSLYCEWVFISQKQNTTM